MSNSFSIVRRHRRQITEVPNNRGTKQQRFRRAEVEKILVQACNKSNEDDWTERTALSTLYKTKMNSKAFRCGNAAHIQSAK